MSKTEAGKAKQSIETILTHAGRHPDDQFGFVNTPVFRGSTVLFRTLADLDKPTQPYLYGRAGTPTTAGAEAVVTALEGAHATTLVPSGLAAITVALLSSLKSGDEVLMTDSAYGPARAFADQFLSAMGIGVRYYDPRLGADIDTMITKATKVIWVESPGSLTFEIQDLPAIVKAARPHGVRVMVDNSWASPLYYRPLELGADVVVHAGTKMFVGHSDALIGTISATEPVWPDIALARRLLGMNVAGDDAYLMARGLRTLGIRMQEQSARALELAQWLTTQEGVLEVYHPALSTHPDHDLFKRDFTGSGSLFAVRLESRPRQALAAMLDNFELFAMGFSWGGYESLCVPTQPEKARTATTWDAPGQMLRINVGFEGIEDLKTDLGAGLTRYFSNVS